MSQHSPKIARAGEEVIQHEFRSREMSLDKFVKGCARPPYQPGCCCDCNSAVVSAVGGLGALQTTPSRILVITCRSGLEGAGMNLADANFKARVYDSGIAYQQSKLALAYFAMEMAVR